MKISKKLFVIAFSLFVFAEGAKASNIFSVNEIEVSSVGQTSIEAKNLALVQGGREALEKLLKRITPKSSDYPISELEDEQISEMILGIDIEEEKITSSYYSASISISFNPVFVQKILDEADIKHISKKSEPILVIPLIINGNDHYYKPDSMWSIKWQEVAKKNPLIDWLFLKGAEDDLIAINAIKNKLTEESYDEYFIKDDEEVEKLELFTKDKAIEKLLQKYKAKKILMAEIIFETDSFESDELYKIRLNDLRVSLSYLGGGNENKKYRKFSSKKGELIDKMMEYAASSIARNIQRKWKKIKEESQLYKKNISVIIPVDNIKSWNDTLNKLKNLSFLTSVDTKMVNAKYGLVDLHFQDSYDVIVDLLASENLYIENEEDSLILRGYDIPPEWFEQDNNIVNGSDDEF